MSGFGRVRTAACALLASGALVLAACGDEEPESASAPAAEEQRTDGEDTQRVVIESPQGAFDARAVYDAASPGVVTVSSIFGGGTPTDILGGGGQGQGSGFVISGSGEILTNAHVVTDASTTGSQSAPLNAADEVYVQFADLNQVEAEVVGFDPFADVALLRIDPEGLELEPLPLGSENEVEVGDAVAAIGSPFGQVQSLSVGIVSATDRSIDSLTNFKIDGAIQTDASINPGNSGGPLLDAEGKVIGINQQIQTSSGGNEGVGFAVPIDLAERSADDLRDDGEVSYAYAGVETRQLYPQLAEELDLEVESGALIARVIPGSPADEAGLQAGTDPIPFQGVEYPAGGDVIVAVNGEPIAGDSDLPQRISLLEPGAVVRLEVIRDGESREVELELGERPDTIQR